MACDPCKLRRIKCDLLTLSAALDSGSATPYEDEPAHLLVRRHPGVICTQCRNKGLQCSTEGILNPLKPNKGGKRIDEARQRFGGDTVAHTPVIDYGRADFNDRAEGSGGMDWTSGPGFVSLLDQLGMKSDGSGPPPIAPSTATADDWQTVPAQTSTATLGRPRQDPSHLSHPSSAGDPPHMFSTFLNSMDDFPTSFASSSNGHSTLYPSPTPSFRATPEIQRQAVEVWDRLSVNTPQIVANRSLRPSTSNSNSREDSVDLDAHTPHHHTLVPALGRLDIETDTFLPVVPLDSGQAKSASGAIPGEAYGTRPGRPETMIRYEMNYGGSSGGQNGKRQRSFDSAQSTPSSSAFELLQPWERDPWHIWQAKDENGSRTVAWSRKEQVQESLADKALGIELSRHLITVYFQAVHFSLPVRQL